MTKIRKTKSNGDVFYKHSHPHVHEVYNGAVRLWHGKQFEEATSVVLQSGKRVVLDPKKHYLECYIGKLERPMVTGLEVITVTRVWFLREFAKKKPKRVGFTL